MSPTIHRLLTAATPSASLEALKAQHGPPPWSVPLMLDDAMESFLIHQAPGHLTDTHYHKSVEWWVILEGELLWYFEGRETEPVHARAGDFVIAPPYTWHHIVPTGDAPTTRIAIRHRGEFHRYDRPGCGPAGSPDQWRPGSRQV
jgi:mannose-6-phosphate isomerase-like protein (cupin superfamily)